MEILEEIESKDIPYVLKDNVLLLKENDIKAMPPIEYAQLSLRIQQAGFKIKTQRSYREFTCFWCKCNVNFKQVYIHLKHYACVYCMQYDLLQEIKAHPEWADDIAYDEVKDKIISMKDYMIAIYRVTNYLPMYKITNKRKP